MAANIFTDARRIPRGHCKIRHASSHHGAGPDHRPPPYGYPGKNHRPRGNPSMVADMNGPIKLCPIRIPDIVTGTDDSYPVIDANIGANINWRVQLKINPADKRISPDS